jgi:recombination protein U
MRNMANLGKAFEEEVKLANNTYLQRGIALVQKISTPWVVIRRGKQIVSAFPEGKSTLDFRGTVKGGMSISFDCKESEDERGLPLKHIQPHQIDYMRQALEHRRRIIYPLLYEKSGQAISHYGAGSGGTLGQVAGEQRQTRLQLHEAGGG